MAIDTIETTFTKTSLMDIHTIAKELNAALGPTLVAVLAGVRDRKLPTAWAKPKPEGTDPRAASETKLKAAYRVWLALTAKHGDAIARSWFIGLNPLLDETAPGEALNAGRTREVIEAARAFLDDNVGS